MINLIPPSAQSQVKREYWIRVISVWLFLIGLSFLVLAIIHAPVYVLVRSQLQSFQEEYNHASDTSETFKNSEAAVTTANEMAKLLAASSETVPFSAVISKIEMLITGGIIVNDFSMSRKGNATNPIVITGEADSRAVLSAFKEAIENDPMFKSAALPLSDLAKDKDIPFSITITLE